VTKYVIIENGRVVTTFAGPQDAADKPGYQELTDAEYVAMANLPDGNVVRDDRNSRLAASDWSVLTDAQLSAAQKTAWKVYRQALRDVPAQAGFPAQIDWPIAP
jgi:hypothetical protein